MNAIKIESEWLYLNAEAIPWRLMVGAEILTESGQRHLIAAVEEREWWEWPSGGPLLTVCAQEGSANRKERFTIKAFNNGPFKALVLTAQQAASFVTVIAQIDKDRIEREISERSRLEAQQIAQDQAARDQIEQEKHERERQEARRLAQEQDELNRLRELRPKRENYITALKLRMMSHQSADTNSIRDVVATRKIPYLVHFTRIENIASILDHGIIPRTLLSPGFHFNDEKRSDRFPESISLSISFPNWQMFFSCRCAERNRGANWVVLAISTETLVTHPCLFFSTNAAHHRFHDDDQETYSTRMGLAGLNSMFLDDSSGLRGRIGLPDKETTDPQAEILVFDRISPGQIDAISLMHSDANTAALIRRQLPTARMNIGGELFRPRADYKFWQANSKASVLNTSDNFDDFPF